MSDGNQALSGGFHHVAMRVRDFDASVKFYTQTLGMRPATSWVMNGTRAALLDAGGGNFLEIFGGGEGGDAAPDQGPILHLALRSDDVPAATERARQAGMEITVEPKDVDLPSDPPIPVRVAFFKGPDGELLEFFQQR